VCSSHFPPELLNSNANSFRRQPPATMTVIARRRVRTLRRRFTGFARELKRR
jgi:hypothetical protein